jgi:hypothetical protein
MNGGKSRGEIHPPINRLIDRLMDGWMDGWIDSNSSLVLDEKVFFCFFSFSEKEQ